MLNTQSHSSPIPFRASEVTLNQLEELKEKWGENRSKVILRCIERIWWQEIGVQRTPEVKSISDTKSSS
jgi:hypothetical protein